MPRGAGPGELDLDAVIPKSEQRSMSSASCFAVVAADEAMKQAELKLETEEEALRAGAKRAPVKDRVKLESCSQSENQCYPSYAYIF